MGDTKPAHFWLMGKSAMMCLQTAMRLCLGLFLFVPVPIAPVLADDQPAEAAKALSPAEAAARLAVPEGFQVTLFAGEPLVRQPIGISTDARGRLWVVENDTYSDQTLNFDLSRHDRIVILEDVDRDGMADKRTVFWDQAQKATSVEFGFGGVWVLAAPRLLFLPDQDHDDAPDGEPIVVLDGWNDSAVRHNIVNGLKWGPDGWLYGRHGIQATSYVGAPGTPRDQRTPINCGIWRYHPTSKRFEVVCRGGTNAWGHDWDQHGELFFINTVIGHLWHAVPGAHFERMYGEDFNPNLYRLMSQTADHYHWDTNEKWSDIRNTGVTPTTSQAGGGHAHSGMMIYQGDNWPAAYRGGLFTINLHGRRVNHDRLERQGVGYVGKHAPDFARSSDQWFRAVEITSADDGGAYIADWSDIGECHENDGVERGTGRIYKLTYGPPRKPEIADVARLDDEALVRLQLHQNDWFARQARHELHQRAVAGRPMKATHDALRSQFESQSETVAKLRALWGLVVTGGAQRVWLESLLDHPDEHVRVWAVRLLVDDATAPPGALASAFAKRAQDDPSGLVRLYLASALQRLPMDDRWDIAERLARSSDITDDRLVLMTWYGIEPAVAAAPDRAIRLARQSPGSGLSRFIARRLTQDIADRPEPVERLVRLLVDKQSVPLARQALLYGMSDGLQGWRRAPRPASWDEAQAALAADENEVVRDLARELALLFGDGRALDELTRIAGSNTAELAARRNAIRVLVEARSESVLPLLNGLLNDRDLAPDAVRGLSVFGAGETTDRLLKLYPRFSTAARAEVIVALASRPATAPALIAAIRNGTIARDDVPTYYVRQMQGFLPKAALESLAALWPELRPVAADKQERLSTLKARLTPDVLAKADRSLGRALFAKSCASCHVLFGEGTKIGPDLTGAQRTSLDYVLENLVDPSASVGADYRMAAVVLKDGRILNGLVGGRSAPTITIQTPTEKLVVPRNEVEELRETNLSLMPDGQLDVMNEDQVRDLIAYVMSPVQVPLPTTDSR